MSRGISGEFGRYGLVTLLSYLALLAGTYVGVALLRIPEGVAYFIVVTLVYLGVFFAYTRFVFPSRFNHKTLSRYLVATAGFWFFNNILFNVMVYALGLNYLFAAAVNIVGFGLIRFSIQRRWVFRAHLTEPAASPIKGIRYVTLARVPTEKAYGHQMVKMCEAFSDAGLAVELWAPAVDNAISEDLYTYYGVPRSFALRRVPVFDFLNRFRVFKRMGYVLRTCAALFQFATTPVPEGTLIYTRHPSVCAVMAWKGVPAVFECHEWFGRSLYWSLWLLRSCPRIVVTNRYLKERFIQRGFRAESILVAPNGVDTKVFDITLSKEEALAELPLESSFREKLAASFVVMYTGSFRTMRQEKGIADILQALVLLQKSVLFAAVGGSEEDRAFYGAEAKRLGVGDRAFFLGKVAAPQLAIFQKAADALLMPFPRIAHYEYFMTPLKMFEYMASGRPIIASDLPSIREVLNEKNALFVPPGDPKALAQAVRTLMNEPSHGKDIAAHAISDVSKYTWEERARSILATLAA